MHQFGWKNAAGEKNVGSHPLHSRGRLALEDQARVAWWFATPTAVLVPPGRCVIAYLGGGQLSRHRGSKTYGQEGHDFCWFRSFAKVIRTPVKPDNVGRWEESALGEPAEERAVASRSAVQCPSPTIALAVSLALARERMMPSRSHPSSRYRLRHYHGARQEVPPRARGIDCTNGRRVDLGRITESSLPVPTLFRWVFKSFFTDLMEIMQWHIFLQTEMKKSLERFGGA